MMLINKILGCLYRLCGVCVSISTLIGIDYIYSYVWISIYVCMYNSLIE